MTVKVLYSEQQIQKRVGEIGSAIREDAGEAGVVVIGILKGTTVFIADLIRQISGNVRYEFIDVMTDVSDTETAAALEINFLAHFPIAGQKVYLLKDVVSTGVIETYLLNQLRQKGPKSLNLIALLDRPELRTVPLEVDWAVFTVGDGTYVGYGLEHDHRYGNLPYLGVV